MKLWHRRDRVHPGDRALLVIALAGLVAMIVMNVWRFYGTQ